MRLIPRLLSALTTGALAAGLLGVGSITDPRPAEAAIQVTDPCARLASGQTKYSGHGANRVTFATTTDRSESHALVTTCVRAGNTYHQDWQSPGHVGRSGFKAPGVPSGHTQDEYSPTGSFSVTEGFGLWNPGTKLTFHVLNPDSRWGGRSNGNYNHYFESNEDIWPDENLWDFATRATGDYQHGVVLNYNRPPDSDVRHGEGFAIFLHSNPVPTAGCISLPESVVTTYLQDAQPGDRVIMGAVEDVFTPHTSDPFGPITQKYAALDGQVGLGGPTSNETGFRGGAYQNYEHGLIAWSAAGGTRVIEGAIRDAWLSDVAENGTLGHPTTGERKGLRSGGVSQNYQGGTIVSSPATGARMSTGPIRAAWQQTGSENGPLGYPTSNVIASARGLTYQNYQHGIIYYLASTGARIITTKPATTT